jgi:hypothetical protein
VTDGNADLTREQGGKAWVLDLNEGKLRTFADGFNIGCGGVGVAGRKLMRGDMKCVCKGAQARRPTALPRPPPPPSPTRPAPHPPTPLLAPPPLVSRAPRAALERH